MSDHARDPSEDLAQWLADVGRRTWRPLPPAGANPVQNVSESREDLFGYLEQLVGRELKSRADVRDYLVELSARGCADEQIRRRRQVTKDTVLLLALLTAYIQYHFLDVSLQIARLPSTLVFVPVEARSSPPRSNHHALWGATGPLVGPA